MKTRPSWIWRLADATSQWVNVALLDGCANESISGRAYRQGVVEESMAWLRVMRLIDRLFFWQQRHCEQAFLADLWRARRLVGLPE